MFAWLVLFSAVASLDVRISRPPATEWKRTQCGSPAGNADLPTKWAADVSANKSPLPEYPRPSLVRGGGGRDSFDTNSSTWKNLNGLWEWQAAESSDPHVPSGRTLNSSILVPFPVESCLSGVAPAGSDSHVDTMWYRLVFSPQRVSPSSRLLLHFGAVDWQAAVYLQGNLVANHTGGYDPFSVELPSALLQREGDAIEVLVRVFDPSDSGSQPNGKQFAGRISNPGGDTYTPTSGIWQTVWLEEVPSTFISRVQLSVGNSSVTATASCSSPLASAAAGGGSVAYTVLDPHTGAVVASAKGSFEEAVKIPIPSAQLWAPGSAFLYDMKVESGEDSVLTYFGLRTFTLANHVSPPSPPTGPQVGVDRPGGDMPGMPVVVQGDGPSACWAQCNATTGCVAWSFGVPNCGGGGTQPLCWLKDTITQPGTNKCRVSGEQGRAGGLVKRPTLNGVPVYLAGWLDQSFWPDGQYTAPTDQALAFDIEAVATFGLNMVRLHQKVNPDRWYWHADKAGVLVFQDAVQKYGGPSAATVPLYVHDLLSMIHARGNHPCIVQWEAFNEGDCWQVFNTHPYTVADIVQLIRDTDWQQRPVDTDSGGGANSLAVGDVNDIHTYPNPGHPLPSATKYGMVGEFGGVGAFIQGKEWVANKCHTYLKVSTPQEEADTYVNMAKALLRNAGDISASVYTQITDVELECDGFLNYDRTSKFNENQTRAIFAANQALIKAGSGL